MATTRSTASARASAWRTKFVPMKPAAPVTRRRMPPSRTRPHRTGKCRSPHSRSSGAPPSSSLIEPAERRRANALPLHLRERREPHEAGRDGGSPEGAQPEQRELHAEETLVRVRLVGDPGLDHPAIAARDEAQEVVTLEEVGAERRRPYGRRARLVARGEGEAQVVPEPQVEGAVELVHAEAVQERRLECRGRRAPVHVALDEAVRDADGGRALEVAHDAGGRP